jgi:hypothetical protein
VDDGTSLAFRVLDELAVPLGRVLGVLDGFLGEFHDGAHALAHAGAGYFRFLVRGSGDCCGSTCFSLSRTGELIGTSNRSPQVILSLALLLLWLLTSSLCWTLGRSELSLGAYSIPLLPPSFLSAQNLRAVIRGHLRPKSSDHPRSTACRIVSASICLFDRVQICPC